MQNTVIKLLMIQTSSQIHRDIREKEKKTPEPIQDCAL